MATSEAQAVRRIARLADRLALAGDTGVVPEGWQDPVDCAEAARAIRLELAGEPEP